MDLDTIVVAGILGFAVVSALALVAVLVMTRPGRHHRSGMGVWDGQSTTRPYAVASQPDPAKLAA